MNNATHEPQPPALPVTQPIRHDGWTGEKMATLLETLAETAPRAHARVIAAFAAYRGSILACAHA